MENGAPVKDSDKSNGESNGKDSENGKSSNGSGSGGASAAATKGQSDVASILARRVAVEMSDSDAAGSDSEYDSDDWGDESTA